LNPDADDVPVFFIRLTENLTARNQIANGNHIVRAAASCNLTRLERLRANATACFQKPILTMSWQYGFKANKSAAEKHQHSPQI